MTMMIECKDTKAKKDSFIIYPFNFLELLCMDGVIYQSDGYTEGYY